MEASLVMLCKLVVTALISHPPQMFVVYALAACSLYIVLIVIDNAICGRYLLEFGSVRRETHLLSSGAFFGLRRPRCI